jgi:hypothetical protein
VLAIYILKPQTKSTCKIKLQLEIATERII